MPASKKIFKSLRISARAGFLGSAQDNRVSAHGWVCTRNSSSSSLVVALRPRSPLIRFCGVLTPNAKRVAQVWRVLSLQATQGAGDCNHERGGSACMTGRGCVNAFEFEVECCDCGGRSLRIAGNRKPDVIEMKHKQIGLDPPPDDGRRGRRCDWHAADVVQNN